MDYTQQFELLRKKLIERDFGRMNDRQFEAVTTTEGAVWTTAGAGFSCERHSHIGLLFESNFHPLPFSHAQDDSSAPFRIVPPAFTHSSSDNVDISQK